MRFETLQGWLHWLESCHPSEIELGLDRVGSVAERLGITLSGPQVITVAGTNGKGSCVASLNALLMTAGARVGCYTSPHFLTYNERVKINGQSVSDQSLINAFGRIDQARADIPLTYFEFGTLAALDIFQHSELDVVVLEVGLGGRLDAVNIIDPDIAIVTSIAIDHQDWLGADRELIGAEKAGIFRKGRPAICADPCPPDSLKSVADKVGAHWYSRGIDFDVIDMPPQNSDRHCSQSWTWQGRSALSTITSLAGLPIPQLPLDSVVAAIQAVQLLNAKEPGEKGAATTVATTAIDITAVDYQCLAELQLPGRFQCFDIQGRQLILDVAHNPAAAHYLAKRLAQVVDDGVVDNGAADSGISANRKTFALMAVMADKDVQGIVAALKHSFDGWFVAELNQAPRAMAAAELADIIQGQGINTVDISKTIGQACQRVLSLMVSGDRLVVFGSFFTVAEVMHLQSSLTIE